jgi:LL-diaminopimelate aminotransferase
MKVARRIENLPPYLFVEISRKIAEKKARGEDVISFGIGDPDIPTPPHIIKRLLEAAQDPANHRYPESIGLPELRKAIADWYQTRFGVNLDPENEVVPLIGAKEGIAHAAFCFVNPGDTVLIPDPGYPVYAIGTALAGGQPYYLPLTSKKRFLPDLTSIHPDVLQKAKVLWINYPNNPTGAIAGPDFFAQVVEFAKKNDIIVLHDGPYTEVAFDGYKPVSFLQTPGAKDVGIEFHSFSKSYNMTGWRIGMAVGNPMLVKALATLKSNIDSGIPQSIQLMAVEALRGPQDCIHDHNNIYQRRRDLVVEGLNKMGLEAEVPKAGLYVWARVPPGYTSASFTADLLDQCGVVVTPGTGYGRTGEGYVRLSLTIPDALLIKGLSKLAGWHDTVNKFKAKT